MSVRRLAQYRPSRLERGDRKREHSTEWSRVDGNSHCSKPASSKDLRDQPAKRMTNNRWLSLQPANNLFEVIRHLADCLVSKNLRLRLRFIDRLRVVRPPWSQRGVASVFEDFRPAVSAARQQPEAVHEHDWRPACRVRSFYLLHFVFDDGRRSGLGKLGIAHGRWRSRWTV